MRTLIRPLLTAWRRGLLRAAGIAVGPDTEIQAAVRVRRIFVGDRAGSVRIGGRGTLSQGVVIESWGGDVTVEDGVFVGPYTVIYGHGGVRVGRQTLISMHCRILSSNHTVPAPGQSIRSQPDILLPTRIGDDVWLGAGVTVLGGVTIGDGCVVGAGAVVSDDLPPNSVALGIPARVVRSRA